MVPVILFVLRYNKEQMKQFEEKVTHAINWHWTELWIRFGMATVRSG